MGSHSFLAQVDFGFVRAEVGCTRGQNGHVSVDPVILLKLMFLLFFDDVGSEREWMATLPERLDYLWFLGLGLDDAIPDRSVLSEARRRWHPRFWNRLGNRATIERAWETRGAGALCFGGGGGNRTRE